MNIKSILRKLEEKLGGDRVGLEPFVHFSREQAKNKNIKIGDSYDSLS